MTTARGASYVNHVICSAFKFKIAQTMFRNNTQTEEENGFLLVVKYRIINEWKIRTIAFLSALIQEKTPFTASLAEGLVCDRLKN